MNDDDEKKPPRAASPRARVSIRKETLRHLTNADLDRVAGGLGEGGDEYDALRVTNTCCFRDSCVTKRMASEEGTQDFAANDGVGAFANDGAASWADASYGADSAANDGGDYGGYAANDGDDTGGDSNGGDYSGGDTSYGEE